MKIISKLTKYRVLSSALEALNNNNIDSRFEIIQKNSIKENWRLYRNRWIIT